MMNKPTNGGARPGSGRKPGIEREYIGARLPRGMVNFLRYDPNKTITEMIETAVREYYHLTQFGDNKANSSDNR